MEEKYSSEGIIAGIVTLKETEIHNEGILTLEVREVQ